MIRLIALDLDGTTLQSGKGLSEHTKEIMEEAIRRGVTIVAASGRSYHSFPEVMWQVEGLEYAIGSNGSSVYRLSTGERLWYRILVGDRVRAILEVLDRYPDVKIALEGFVDGRGYADRRLVEAPRDYGIVTDAGSAYIRRTRKPVEDMRAFLLEHDSDLDAIDMLIPDVAKKQEIQAELAKLSGIYVTSSQVYMIELGHEESGKGAAVKWLAEQLQIAPEEILACGNAENDIDMITYAGIGVAVANAEDAVKAAADYITEDNDHEGVSKVIEKFVLNV